MLCAKYGHGLCSILDNIYAIGGYRSGANLNDCQKYESKKNIWSKLPDLSYQRNYMATFVMNNAYIYICFGKNVESCIAEKLNVNIAHNWEIVDVKCCNSQLQYIHGIQISETEALTFGGMTTNSYILKIVDKTIDMQKTCQYPTVGKLVYCSTPTSDGRNIYSIDRNKNINVYNIDSRKWSIAIVNN